MFWGSCFYPGFSLPYVFQTDSIKRWIILVVKTTVFLFFDPDSGFQSPKKHPYRKLTWPNPKGWQRLDGWLDIGDLQLGCRFVSTFSETKPRKMAPRDLHPVNLYIYVYIFIWQNPDWNWPNDSISNFKLSFFHVVPTVPNSKIPLAIRGLTWWHVFSPDLVTLLIALDVLCNSN